MKGRLRFRPNNTGTLATAALTEVTGQSGMARLRGWIELVFEGLHCEALLHPKLTVTYVSSDEAEYLLPAAAGASFQVVLYAKETIASLTIESAREAQSFEVGSCQIISLVRFGILRRAMRSAFTATLVAMFWALLGKKLRARNRLQRILSLPAATNCSSVERWFRPFPFGRCVVGSPTATLTHTIAGSSEWAPAPSTGLSW